MGSSGGGGGNPALLAQQGAPMPGLPIAGQGSSIGSPYEYGQFQNFLPDVQAEGENPMATGLRPDMFVYKSPSGVTAPSGNDMQIQQLRDELARLSAAMNQRGPAAAFPSNPFFQQTATEVGGGG